MILSRFSSIRCIVGVSLISSIILTGSDSEAQVSSKSDSLFTVTHRYVKSTKQKKRKQSLRIQLLTFKDTISIWGFTKTRLPKNIRKISFGRGIESISNSELKKSIDVSLDSNYNFASKNFTEFIGKKPSRAKYELGKIKFKSGLSSGTYFRNQWLRFGTSRQKSTQQLATEFKTINRFGIATKYSIGYFPGHFVSELPELDNATCTDLYLIFIEQTKKYGYGPAKFLYETYKVRDREILRKNFDLYFNQGESIPFSEGANKVVDFLESNNYVILDAVIQGGTSIEGSNYLNRKLEKKRAQVVEQLLAKYSESDIQRDTLYFTDSFSEFRALIKTTPFNWMGSLSNDSIASIIAMNSGLADSLEYIFNLQRIAKLKLTLAKPLLLQEQLSKISSLLSQKSNLYFKSAKLMNETEGPIMGMLDVLLQFYTEDKITRYQLDSLLVTTSNNDWNRVLMGYFLLYKYEKVKNSQEAKAKYLADFIANDYGLFIKNAMSKLSKLMSLKEMNIFRGKLMGMFHDFQAYNYIFIKEKILEPTFLCNVDYPSVSLLNYFQYSDFFFLKNYSRETGTPIYCLNRSYRMDLGPSIKDSLDFDLFLKNRARISPRLTDTFVGFNSIPPICLNIKEDGWYSSIKERMLPLTGNGRERKIVAGKHWLDVFLLSAILDQQLVNWKPEENIFGDCDLRLIEMNKLVSFIKVKGGMICSDDKSDTFLKFHLKALKYLSLYHVPGNSDYTKIAEASLKYITTYYQRYVNVMPPEFVIYLVKQLNAFNTVPGTRAGAWYGFQLLRSVDQQRALSTEEFEILKIYMKLFDPKHKLKYHYEEIARLESRSQN